MVKPETIITPEGYGFTASAQRVLETADRNGGFHKALGGDPVIDVMQEITKGGKQDVALVYDDNDNEKLLGLFTETDYIKVSK